MKIYLTIIGVVLTMATLIGFILPYLISGNTEQLLLGILIIILIPIFLVKSINVIIKQFKSIKK